MDQHDQPRLKASTAAPRSPSSGAKLNDKLIAERVTTLLSHYWTAAEDERLRALQISDWLDDLGEFPAAIVADSCALWRRTESRRPTPGDIRKLCFEMAPKPKAAPSSAPQIEQAQHSPNTVRDNWRTLPWPALTDAEKDLFEANLPVAPIVARSQERPPIPEFVPQPNDPALVDEALAALERAEKQR